jgi:hypothetical protein
MRTQVLCFGYANRKNGHLRFAGLQAMALTEAVFEGFKRAQPGFVDSLATRLQQLFKPKSKAMSSAASSVATEVGELCHMCEISNQMPFKTHILQILQGLGFAEVDGNEVGELGLPADLEEHSGFPMEDYHDEPSATKPFVRWLEVRCM